MRLLTLCFSIILATLAATEVAALGHNLAVGRQPSASVTCKIVTGYGTAIGSGSSKLAAKEAAREICGVKLIDDYLARRGRIDRDVEDDLTLACINLECE